MVSPRRRVFCSRGVESTHLKQHCRLSIFCWLNAESVMSVNLPPNLGEAVIILSSSSSSVGTQGSAKASACPVRSMKESMEEPLEVSEDGLVRRGCKRVPGLVNILQWEVVGVLGYLWLAHLGVSPSSQSLPRLSLCSNKGVSSL